MASGSEFPFSKPCSLDSLNPRLCRGARIAVNCQLFNPSSSIVNMPTSDFATILEQAAQSSSVPTKDALIAALLAAEITAKRERLAIPFESLLGEWRLCFATGASKDKRGGIRLGRGYYLPKFAPASISFTRGDVAVVQNQELSTTSQADTTGTISNKLLVGTVRFQFTGPCRYPGKKNLLAFDFTQIQFKLLGLTVYQGKIRSGKRSGKNFEQLSIAQLPFFSFFWASPNGIAARGRGGGLALWVRN